MVAIEQNIQKFRTETEESINSIIEGSDEHLDLILSVTIPLNKTTKKFEEFNSNVILNNLDEMSDEDIRSKVLPNLRDLNRSCLMLIGAIRTCFLYRDVRSSLKEYTKQHDILREVIHDLNSVRLAKDDEFDDIMKELNSH